MCVNISSKFVLNIPHLNTLSEEGIWVDISWMYACNILQYGHTCRGRTYVYKSRGCLHQISLKEGPLLWRDMCYIFRGTLVQMSQILYDEWLATWSVFSLHDPWVENQMVHDKFSLILILLADFVQVIVRHICLGLFPPPHMPGSAVVLSHDMEWEDLLDTIELC